MVQNWIKITKGLVKAGGGYTNWNLTRTPLLNYICLGKNQQERQQMIIQAGRCCPLH